MLTWAVNMQKGKWSPMWASTTTDRRQREETKNLTACSSDSVTDPSWAAVVCSLCEAAVFAVFCCSDDDSISTPASEVTVTDAFTATAAAAAATAGFTYITRHIHWSLIEIISILILVTMTTLLKTITTLFSSWKSFNTHNSATLSPSWWTVSSVLSFLFVHLYIQVFLIDYSATQLPGHECAMKLKCISQWLSTSQQLSSTYNTLISQQTEWRPEITSESNRRMYRWGISDGCNWCRSRLTDADSGHWSRLSSGRLDTTLQVTWHTRLLQAHMTVIQSSQNVPTNVLKITSVNLYNFYSA